MKKILFVVPHMTGGGAERVASILANKLVDEGHVVYIHTLVKDNSFYQLDERIVQSSDGIKINRSNKVIFYFEETVGFIKSFSSLYHKIKLEKFDIVISFQIETDLMVHLCKKLGLHFTTVYSERNDPWQRSKLFTFTRKHIYQNCDRLICQGKGVYDYYSFVSTEKKIVIPNPIDKEAIPERINNNSKKIVSVARLYPQKNYPLLINSFEKVHKEFPEYTLYIYGGGAQFDFISKLIKEKEMNNSVFLLGPQKNVMQLIADAELFVMSSNYEGFPNALLEAIAIGIPVISTDFKTGVARDLISPDNGILVPINDEEAMVKAMKSLLSNPNKMIEMGKNNREKAKQYYTDKIIDMWISALNV